MTLSICIKIFNSFSKFLNGNIFDYRPENLEWVTPSENAYRRRK